MRTSTLFLCLFAGLPWAHAQISCNATQPSCAPQAIPDLDRDCGATDGLSRSDCIAKCQEAGPRCDQSRAKRVSQCDDNANCIYQASAATACSAYNTCSATCAILYLDGVISDLQLCLVPCTSEYNDSLQFDTFVRGSALNACSVMDTEDRTRCNDTVDACIDGCPPADGGSGGGSGGSGGTGGSGGCVSNYGDFCGCHGTANCYGQCEETGGFVVNGVCCYSPNGCQSNCGGTAADGCGIIECNGIDETGCGGGGTNCGNLPSCTQDSDCWGVDYTDTCQGGCCGYYGGDASSDLTYQDPLMIDLTGRGFALTGVNQGVRFDIYADAHKNQMAWTQQNAQVGFLVLDRNDNGRIDDGSELFGNLTAQPATASDRRNGFIALGVLDQREMGGNQDGVIDEKDQYFSKLRIWIDKNHDGVSQPSELFTLKEVGIKSISVRYEPAQLQDIHGNTFRYRAKVTWENQPVNWMYDVDLVVLEDGSTYGQPQPGRHTH